MRGGKTILFALPSKRRCHQNFQPRDILFSLLFVVCKTVPKSQRLKLFLILEMLGLATFAFRR
jgi:hypothetical protein